MEPRNLTRSWERLCKQLDVRAVPLHALRHTCVSLLLALGVHPRVVMEIVGHTAIEVTMNVYGHVNVDTQRPPSTVSTTSCPDRAVAVNRCFHGCRRDHADLALTCRSAARIRTWTIGTKNLSGWGWSRCFCRSGSWPIRGRPLYTARDQSD
jgi:hypothetical protein